jgi:6-phosphogluconolactonase
MKFQRRSLFAFSVLSLAALAFSMPAAARVGGPGHVYTIDNVAGANHVLAYERGSQGTLTLTQTIATGASGTGAGLGSQGALTLSQDGAWLFAVNAGSGSVSTFSVGDAGLTLVSTVATGGAKPVSVTEYGGIVYVLNAGVGGSVAGFSNADGVLSPLADGMRALSDSIDVGAAEVSFDKLGRTVVVAEKATSRLTTYAAHPDGTLGEPVVNASAGITPFGFVFDNADHLLVSEATTGALSSYKLTGHPAVTTKAITASALTGQLAACWAAVTPDGRYAFAANAASPSISSFRVAHTGALTLAQTTPEAAGAHPVDMVVTPNSQKLFVLNTGNGGSIASFKIAADGSLQALATATVPATANGLAID